MVALILGVLSFKIYFGATAEPALPAFAGTIAVATNDPEDRVELHVRESDNGSGASASTLEIFVDVNPAYRSGGELWVAVGLAGHARPADVATPPDGPLPQGDRGDASRFGVVGLSEEAAYFASKATWPGPSGDHTFTDQIVFGRPAECVNDWCSIALTVPLSQGMVEEVGGQWSLSTPQLGAEPQDSTFPDLDIYMGSQVTSAASEQLERLTGERAWHLPDEPIFRFELSEDRAVDSIQQSGTSPVEPFGQVWQASTPFEVKAFFKRPQLAAQQDRLQFLAGVLVSLAGGLAVWAAEIALTRSPRSVTA